MEYVKVCRICLVTDVKIFNLQGYPLSTYFETIIGINPLSMMELPPYACYECASLVRKYYMFREKCLRGQTALYSILHMNGKITSEEVKQIDRKAFLVTSSLTTNFILEESAINYMYEVDDSQIKEELTTEKYDLDDTDLLIKEEDFNDLPPSPDLMSTDDDEPLSLHKSNKAKRFKKIEKKKGRKVKKLEINNEQKEDHDDKWNVEVEQVIDTGDASELAEITEMVDTKKRKKRGRPKKAEGTVALRKSRRTNNTGGVPADEIVLEEFVTVVKLSLEEQKEEITKRKTSSNYLNAPFQCDLCYKGFIDTHAWKHHLSKHDPTAGDVECPVCKFRFKNKRTLMKHAANHEKKYACKSCSYVSKTATQAKQHQRWHKGVTYKCQYCDEISTKWTSYLSHVRIKHPSEFICGACGYSFVSKLGLTMHKTMMHKDLTEKTETGDSKEAGPYCPECEVQFTSVEAWKRHMVTSAKHTQNEDFNNGCRVCGETFKSSEELRVHHRKEHARKRPKNYGKKPAKTLWPAKCEHCSEEIANARDHWTHFRRAHPDKTYPIEKNYVCDICGKSFRGNAFLVYHKRTHSEERAYKCAQCPKAFFNRTNLQMHERTHSDHRPYQCTMCFKAFKCKGALDRHFRCHTGVKPYECEVCGKAFGQSNSRKLHVRTVHLKQPAPYISRSRQEKRRQPRDRPPPTLQPPPPFPQPRFPY